MARRDAVAVFSAALCLAAALPAVAGDSKKDREPGRGINFYSIEREIALGRQLASEVERQAKLADDPLLTEFVNRLGQNLAKRTGVRFSFTFRVIDDDALNAFALPGGYVFVNTGLIEVAEDEAELAGAIAHEIAHVTARHMTRQATRSDLAELLAIPLGTLGGWTGVAASHAAGFGIPMSLLRFSRGAETEADCLGVRYMDEAGYDPAGAVSMFEKLSLLERKKPGIVSRTFSTHPPDAERVRRTQREIDEFLAPKPEYVVTTSEYADIRHRLIQMQDAKRGPDSQPPRLRRP